MDLLGSPVSFQPSGIGHKGPKVIIYIDNILLHSKTDQEHRAQLEKNVNRLRNTNSKVNQKKCEFGAENARYLGYKLTQKEFCQEGTN